MTMRVLAILLAATILPAASLFAPDAARAGPPYVTDDPEPTDAGKWEIYGFATGTGFAHAVEGEGGFDINYGVVDDLQATAVLSLGYDHARGSRLHAGLADSEFGLKYRFVHQREGGWTPDISFFPAVTLPTAGKRFSNGRFGLELPLSAQKDYGRWSLFGGGAYQINPGRNNRDFAFVGMALTREIDDQLSVGAEVYHQTADSRDGEALTGFGIGMTRELAPHWALIGSGGPLVSHRTANGRFAFYLALAFHD